VWIVALALAVFGLALRAAAVARLGSRFTYDYAVGGGALETRGIYAWIRHPSYLGLLCLTNFLGIALGSLIGVALLASTIPAVLRRIRDEEAALVSHYGEAYDVYRRRAARLIPFVY